MTNPGKVVAFLDVRATGFDYSLAFVMGGAVLTAIGPSLSAFRRRQLSTVGRALPMPASEPDAKLLLGSVLFGVGWGLAGLCPGPALVGLATLKPQLIAFNIASAFAMILTP